MDEFLTRDQWGVSYFAPQPVRNSFEYECSATELFSSSMQKRRIRSYRRRLYGGACEDAVQIEVASRRDSRPENSNLKIDFRILNFSKKPAEKIFFTSGGSG